MISQIHNQQEIPNTIAVRGIARRVGTTSIAANLALMLAERGVDTLLMDMGLWNYDLTRAFGHPPKSALIELAQEDGELPINSVDSSIVSLRQNLDLLPCAEHWFESPALRAENGWNFIHAFLAGATERWSTILCDLGSHIDSSEQRAHSFVTPSAVHASILQASSHIIGVCDSIEYLKLWQERANQDSFLDAKTIYVVNQHHPDLPFGLDRYRVNPNMRSQSHLIPALKSGLLADDAGLFFVERFTQAGDSSAEDNRTLREFQDLTARVNRRILRKEESDRSAEHFSDARH